MNPITKKLLRKVFLEYRRILDTNVYEKRNALLCQNLVTFIGAGNYKTIHTFLAMERNNEPDLSGMFSDLRKSGHELMTSVTNFNDKTLQHFSLKEDTRLVKNNLGIPEPEEAMPANIDKADLILVPLLASDKNGNRIGYGGGYYDRLLKETSALKVGLSLSPTLDEMIQSEDWDITLDKIITPFEVI